MNTLHVGSRALEQGRLPATQWIARVTVPTDILDFQSRFAFGQVETDHNFRAVSMPGAAFQLQRGGYPSKFGGLSGKRQFGWRL